MIKIKPRYNPNNIKKIYKQWEDSKYFNPSKLPPSYKKPFCIIMPPPNANGSLHIGHAVFITIQDILIRFYRMNSYKTLWLPGADHAGFETQVVFDKKLEKEGKNRFEIPEKKLYQEILKFTKKNKKIMENQLRQLGASCDWSREKFTLDPEIIKIVYQTFKKLYDDGLIYRDLKIVNWCPKHKTALSDLETNYIERQDPLFYIKYGPLTVATVRPETKFGDTALAVHPKDLRYKNFIGQEIEARDVLGKIKIKIIADELVDPNFGTGVVKITPAHDPQDFEIWKKHQNEIPGPKIVIDENGRLNEHAGKFAGLKTIEARSQMIEVMKKNEILEKIEENYVHKVAVCYKCKNILEPLPKKQWFIAMTKKSKSMGKSLQELGIEAIKKDKIKFYPQHAQKIYLHWLKNLKDWNISRQIVWGIKIPVWYCQNCKYINVAVSKPRNCLKCKSKKLIQEKDVFDTWFSSGQWPFATLGFPSSFDFKTFYPTDVMETGYDILFFWVARMIMLGKYATRKIPFKKVYLHGLVLDKDKQKMSKSKGNVIDPLGVANIYGPDALRMALVIGNTAGRDIIISEEKIKAYRNFTTKIWNIARFILLHQPPKTKLKNHFENQIKKSKEFKNFIKIKNYVEKNIKDMKFHLAAEKLYHYIWHNFADKILENSKPKLINGDLKEKNYTYLKLEKIFTEALKILHPFMPFITEELYQKFYPQKLLLIEKW